MNPPMTPGTGSDKTPYKVKCAICDHWFLGVDSSYDMDRKRFLCHPCFELKDFPDDDITCSRCEDKFHKADIIFYWYDEKPYCINCYGYVV